MALKETWSEASYRRALLWLVLTISLAVREVLHRQRGRFLPLGKTGQELPRIGVQRGQRPICPLVQALSGKGLAPSAQDARAASASPVPARGRAKISDRKKYRSGHKKTPGPLQWTGSSFIRI